MSDRRIRILVADDEALIRMSLRSFLHNNGFDVQTATDGRDALTKLDDFQPDIVLLDLLMPHVDGLGVFREAQQRLPHVRAIFMTGLPDTSRAAMEAGSEQTVSFVSKPIDFETLLGAIAAALPDSGVRG